MVFASLKIARAPKLKLTSVPYPLIIVLLFMFVSWHIPYLRYMTCVFLFLFLSEVIYSCV
jgi:hypothetical protein